MLFSHRRPCSDMRSKGFHFSDYWRGAKRPAHPNTGCCKHFRNTINKNGIVAHGRYERYRVVVVSITKRKHAIHLVEHDEQLLFSLTATAVFRYYQMTDIL